MTGTALVTGAASGIGKAAALALKSAGWEVIGTSRTPETVGADLAGTRFLRLDLMDENSIAALLGQVGTVDVLVNSAGASLMSAVEETPVAKIRGLFELIVFGNVRLMQGVLPGMRAAGRGLIINIGSYAEVTPVPCSSIYAGAKAALHVLSAGLRQEVRPFGVKIVTVAPTFIKTPIVQERFCAENSAYAGMIQKAGAVRDKNIDSGSSPDIVARQILKIVRAKNPASFYPVGKNARLFPVMQRILPERVREAVIRRHYHL
ncbi:Short-chain dehydrogenase [Sporobacter termitidis DSM 10068]|uniref:Short-chain dehydrogenase n=1 Tax=Sporobacter termitidis DSM 10068 TaxID=1123282 RepID=A0A1M5YLH0_9FIRM|nr:SDR family NAD(P)-dependent oxidoreductase [Sporobacter termitidis]SHI12684.1 Short-chain dehydrogenase [Sporobacter termitidis DSM 10068]